MKKYDRGDEMQSDVLTIEAAGKHYEGTALTPSAIRRLVRSGEIPARKVGKKYLITIEAIENWLKMPTQEEMQP
jgi:excisionase family DNA binding protein